MSVRIRITKGKIIFSLLILLIGLLFIWNPVKTPIYWVSLDGKTLKFRVDLREASKVPVYPSEDEVKNFLMSPLVENITIYYIAGSGEENSRAAVEVFELTYKLSVTFSRRFGYLPNFEVVNITSFEGINGTMENPGIAIVDPVRSNETSVRLVDGVIFIAGNYSESSEEKMKNLDLATARLIITAIGVKY